MESHAGGGESHRGSRPDEKLDSQILLQFRDVLAHGRLSDTQFLGGTGETAQSGDCHEDSKSEILQHEWLF
jgi:hypothetical protein